MTTKRPTPSHLAIRCRRVEGPPVVSVRVWIRGGARSETIPGQALISGRALSEGTRNRTWRAIAEEAEARGMMLSSFAGFEFCGVAIDALAEDWQLALEWAAELALEPAFPEDRCRWLARQATAELQSLADQPEVRTAWAFLEQLYTPHPRARPIQGTAEDLASLSAADCVGFHRQGLAQGLIVTVAGRIDSNHTRTVAEGLFRGVSSQALPVVDVPSPTGLAEVRREVSTGSADQAHFYAGHLTVAADHPAVPALELVGVVLGSGSGLTARIPYRIREQEGLAYVVGAETVAGAGLDPGRLMVYVGTAPENLSRTELAVREEVTRLLESGITDQEMQDARAYLLGREPFRRETARQWSEILAAAEFYGLPVDDPDWMQERWRRLDRSEVEETARRHLEPDRLQITIGR
ncbi:MAG: pitrilysin family protein [Thermoanaerobaculia bacterium]